MNTKKVYDIVLNQVINNSTYAPKPFEASYDARIILQNTLKKISEEGRDLADSLKLQGLSEEEIIDKLNIEENFLRWENILKNEITNLKITYKYTE